MVFYIAVGVYCLTALIFIVFGSAELQDWGSPKQKVEVPKSDDPVQENGNYLKDFEKTKDLIITHL